MALVTMWYIHQNCNFGRGNDNRPLEVRGDYLLSDTAMMVISHAYVVRECLISEDPPNPTNCCVGFPSSKWSFRVLHLKFLVYTSLDLCSLWMFHIYCTRFTICLVFLWNVQSVFVRHAVAISATCFLWKSVFFDDWLRGFFCFSAAGFWAAWHAPQQYLGCCARVPIGSLGNLDIAWW